MMDDNINMESTIAGSMDDNINMESTIAGSMNDNINMESTIAGGLTPPHFLDFQRHMSLSPFCVISEFS
jgi:hypothetical protein